ncbi:hypothetical protein RB623_06530 [Mesorhizobium sp. LHD-90]|uniref:hypothetical protein n=1 Tax=Mesorhizobium sp. LHD-90 TaxID=3071414 RepID=UPI0027DF2F5E|nr:hypothetical protein [Mesorhizobium sp. LHD-90]MDQ6433705.1 hypothetical protein [Mesorhizobium sp. LHD-90]
MIKFVLAALWICAATLGAVFYSFQSAGTKSDAPAQEASLMGGLDYVKTDVISVPLIRNASVEGYFLARLVYTVDPRELRKLTVPADALITDVVYSYVYSTPALDFSKTPALDLDAFRAGIRDGINKRVKQQLVEDVLVEQVDYLTKEEIRDNAVKRRKTITEEVPATQDADASSGGHDAAPAH